MKRMNFIETISAQKHQEIRRWLLFSSVTLGAIFIGILFFQSMEVYEFYTVHTQLVQAQTHLDALQFGNQAKETLQQKKSALVQLKTHIAECTSAPCSPHDSLCMLTKLSALPINLQSVQLHQKGIEVTAQAITLQHATQALEQLKKESSLSQLELISITPEHTGLLFRIKGIR